MNVFTGLFSHLHILTSRYMLVRLICDDKNECSDNVIVYECYSMEMTSEKRYLVIQLVSSVGSQYG